MYGTRTVLFLLLSIEPALAGLSSYSSQIVADPPNSAIRTKSIRITYLGTNGYQFETGGHALVVDPYFTRISLARAGLGWSVRPNEVEIDKWLRHMDPRIDGILVTHGHFDHLLDVPFVMQRTHATLFASSIAIDLATRAGASRNKCKAMQPGMTRQIGPWRITALSASHDRVPLMGIPFNGAVKGDAAPIRARDWVCGQPLSYLIVANGKRIFVDSGGTPAVLPPTQVGPVDLAILGVALPDSRSRFAAAVTRLRPRYVLPSHQDNFFLPLERGFQFATFSDFSFVRGEHERQQLPGRLVLLDYFRPWTLPSR